MYLDSFFLRMWTSVLQTLCCYDKYIFSSCEISLCSKNNEIKFWSNICFKKNFMKESLL